MMSDEYTQKMKKLRANIDVLDATRSFVRMKVADEIGGVKKAPMLRYCKTPDGTKF
jgi:chorismate mutase